MRLSTAFYVFALIAIPGGRSLPTISGNSQNRTLINGEYSIEGCGSYTPRLQDVMEAALAAIPPVIKDANDAGSHSLYGFKTMFKLDVTIPLVVAVLENIAKLTPLPGLRPDPSVLQSPHFVCVTPETAHLYRFLPVDPYFTCSVSPMTSFYIAGTPYTFICPSFWGFLPYPIELPLTEHCPRVKNNVFLTYPGYEVWNYQSYIIIHELVHFYLQETSLSGTSVPPEQYHINGCVELDTVSSLHNPLNYQTYVAMVQQGCVQSPDPFLPPWTPEVSASKPNLPQLNASSSSGFSSSQPDISDSTTFTLPRLNFSLSSGSDIATKNTAGAANVVGTS